MCSLIFVLKAGDPMQEITKSRYEQLQKSGANVKRTKGRYWLLGAKEVKEKPTVKIRKYSSVRW